MGVRIIGDNMTVPGRATVAELLASLMVLSRTTVSLIADAQAVPTDGEAYLALSSNNATAANRDFALAQGEAGQILVIEWVGTNAGQIVDDSANSDSGNVRLSANWVPTQYDILVLICNGTDWIELCRSAN